ncbi:hypothetical protein Agub_g6503 [Astrephomene gubernaculifera]|uniref:DUF7811 domain-containing protein n=1 Tax=Astrephomene gubernaculifera TaxID=47775 RepID=A0AAD3HLH3_9CHLO|nr:hypothetical protein Agub_g6503 [Astrephomene gubernaculifera]
MRTASIASLPYKQVLNAHVAVQRVRRNKSRACTPVCQARKRPGDGTAGDDRPENMEMVREIITFVTSDGIVRVPGNRVLRPAHQHKRLVQPMPTWDQQQLCIGSSFTVAATNGADVTRRVNIEGFCQSADYLFAAVQDALESELGGEVLHEERQLKSGLHEVLKLTVAVPLLFGVPPQLEGLNEAIRTGGGIVDRVRHVWLIQAGGGL